MNSSTELSASADDEIYKCLDLKSPKSFFLFAGAGSGKTRTLVTILNKFRTEKGKELCLNGQKIAVITYTNAASDEIKRRLEFDSTFIVSTIHSFSWELIRPFQHDIREWIRKNTKTELKKLEEEQRRGRAGTKAFREREEQIKFKRNRLKNLDNISRFTYNPNGINNGKEALNHAEVIKITADFLSLFPLMQKILISSYPILLIDESQDTKKELIEAFFKIQENFPDKFSLGLFGDTMQRIYTDGKIDLGDNLPKDWAKPAIITNYRCPKRVITLINKIRSDVEEHEQKPVDNAEDGVVRLFIVDSNNIPDKDLIEKNISSLMAEYTSDSLWESLNSNVKILTLEHHMAARRGGFFEFFEPLYSQDKLKTGLLDGNLSGISFLTQQILPLVEAMRANNEFAVAKIMREYSELLDEENLKESETPIEQIKKTGESVDSLLKLWDSGQEPSLLEVLQLVGELNIFPIPENLIPVTYYSPDEDLGDDEEEPQDKDEIIDAWRAALKCPFNQLEFYTDYISDKSAFGTHQGVKGLEFPRVMVVIDDEEARGFMFSYEKLFGAKDLSDTDIRNINEGKESGIDRTRRLFYVTCSRAEKSLAIVAYTKNPEAVKNHVLSEEWFSEDEVIDMNLFLSE
ncbi:ATP-dependent helicase [Methanoplanus sp. FWC-SCC4]|uniref:ATP-dependent helicase n=1 Tax=Methanochimaera problematica TaxID=2609417 RepID=A0AA97FDN5_9EURY|nr:UvrD-helicase domain-containing protein [Methanoplanus sp. FWC-SCC4]WOF16133.1 ATP-dependent helicase [Methanoplanus sp. FWC-SCC4]